MSAAKPYFIAAGLALALVAYDRAAALEADEIFTLNCDGRIKPSWERSGMATCQGQTINAARAAANSIGCKQAIRSS
jgi:hypothetical protein